MKPYLFKHPEAIQNSFFVLNDKASHFYDRLHYHPLFQFMIIKKGKGTFFVGDRMERFEPGDIFLVAPDITHVLKSDPEYYAQGSELESESVAAYFQYDSFGPGFFDLSENLHIKNLLLRSEHGLKISGATAAKMSDDLTSLFTLKGVKRFTTLLLCLEKATLAPAKECSPLASVGFLGSVKGSTNDRMDKVFDYIITHSNQNVRLEEVADIACMTTSAFCRFFKKRTQKSLIQFVNETRIGQASRLLLEEKYSMSHVAAVCGYSNVSHFNRQFKQINKMTPSAYVAAYRM